MLSVCNRSQTEIYYLAFVEIKLFTFENYLGYQLQHLVFEGLFSLHETWYPNTVATPLFPCNSLYFTYMYTYSDLSGSATHLFCMPTPVLDTYQAPFLNTGLTSSHILDQRGKTQRYLPFLKCILPGPCLNFSCCNLSVNFWEVFFFFPTILPKLGLIFFLFFL